jgi:hypothetical protein
VLRSVERMLRSVRAELRSKRDWGGWTLLDRGPWDVGVRYHWHSFLVGLAVHTDWEPAWHYLEVEINAGFVHLSCHYSCIPAIHGRS